MTDHVPDTHQSVPATGPLALKSNLVLGPNVQEDGPWEFGFDVTKGKAYVDSQDFHYDARLHISGDFGGTDEVLAYAKEIARRLNAAPEIERAHNAGFVEASRLHGAEIERLRAMLAEVLPVAWTGGDGMPAAHQEVMARAKAMLDLGPNVRANAAPRPCGA